MAWHGLRLGYSSSPELCTSHHPLVPGMIRLTLVTQTPIEAVLKVEGSVSGEDVAILEEEGARLRQQSHRLVLDLDGVQFVDRAGLALLERWSGERLVLRGGPLYLRRWWERHGVA